MWAFNSPPNYGVNTNPTQGELFVNDKIDRSDALVRETIQNSLDAKRPEIQCVEVCFSLLENSELNWGLVAPYVASLQPHLSACGIESEFTEFQKPSVLVVEDFGTGGLQGKTDEDDGEDFSLFWRNIGESHKEGNRGGRWGLGKTVFPNSSKISTYFGFTVRSNDDRKLLMGQPGGEPPPPPPPPPPPKPQKIKLEQVSGGFVVRPGKDLKPEDLPFSVTVDAAYVVRRGNAFRRYHRSDFEFEKEPIKIQTDPERVVDIAGTGNRLAFKIADADFELEAVGFDKNRDLKLRLNLSLEENGNDQDV